MIKGSNTEYARKLWKPNKLTNSVYFLIRYFFCHVLLISAPRSLYGSDDVHPNVKFISMKSTKTTDEDIQTVLRCLPDLERITIQKSPDITCADLFESDALLKLQALHIAECPNTATLKSVAHLTCLESLEFPLYSLAEKKFSSSLKHLALQDGELDPGMETKKKKLFYASRDV